MYVHFGICAGRDAHPDRGGGTWIGITKTGRFATLTNYRIDMKDFKMDAQGRGTYVHTHSMCTCMYVYCTYTHVHGVLPGYLKACRSNMLFLLQFNTICGEACMHSKIVKNLCLVQIILVPKTEAASNL